MSLAQFVKNQSGFTGLNITYQRGESVLAWAMISPWVAGFLLLTAFPMVASLVLSFYKWNIISAPEFVGLANYVNGFSVIDPLPMHSMKITVIFSLASIPLNIVFGLAIAMLLNTNIRGLSVFRTIYYLPAILVRRGGGDLVAVDFLQRLRLAQYRPAYFRHRGPGLAGQQDLGLAGIRHHATLERRRRHGHLSCRLASHPDRLVRSGRNRRRKLVAASLSASRCPC